MKERTWKLDSHFANKIVTEQIWIMSVTSKIVLQLLELDTDAQLHEEHVISVRKEAEFASRVLPRWNADTLETSCQYDVEELQEEVKVAQKTVVTRQVPRQVQMIQTMTRS